jgi:hypothetical protein
MTELILLIVVILQFIALVVYGRRRLGLQAKSEAEVRGLSPQSHRSQRAESADLPAAAGGPIYLPCDPLGAVPCEHDAYFVSRHDIAECGLKCPRCNQEAATRADYRAVRPAVFPDGATNEAILCRNTVSRDGVETTCGAILLASPDTEHGDELRDLSWAEQTSFVRISRQLARQEKYGPDIIIAEESEEPQLEGLAVAADGENLSPEEQMFRKLGPAYERALLDARKEQRQ